ncbi:hypothetical protein IT575_00055 [bacterium]|nr:hypothetical protein [bacterium]
MESKIIHDAIWGTNEFYPWEVALLDTPLMQRLRYIKQTGLAYFVYPSANHTRFDHTLGVLSAASTVFMRLYLGGRLHHLSSATSLFEAGNPIWHSYFAVRLAALLHDCGHSLLSHTGEKLYSKIHPFPELTTQLNNYFVVDSGAGEIMSYFIASSPELYKFVSQLQFSLPRSLPEGINGKIIADLLNQAAHFIIGYPSSSDTAFCADIINGPYDADKLDYIRRDGHFAGINISYDLDRLLSQLNIEKVWSDKRDESLWKLTVPAKGVNALEQIVISKFMLYSYLYYHPKVRAAELEMLALLRDVIKQSHIDDATQFLELDDSVLREYANSFPRVKQVLNRQLLFKAAELNIRELKEQIERQVKGKGLALDFLNRLINGEFLGQSDALHELVDVIKRTCKARKKRIPKDYELIVDMPGRIKKDQFNRIVIDDPGAKPQPLSEVFPIEAWEESYFQNRWRGYVFAPREYVRIVLVAYRKWLEGYGIKIDDKPELGIPQSKRIGPARKLFTD